MVGELQAQMDVKGSAIVMVAPNGARRGKHDHPALPIRAGELADCAAACAEAGACAIHLHVRDADGRHVLDADAYRDASARIRRTVGDDLVIQITTEAVGLFTVDEQMQVVRDVRPEAVSLAVRELVPDAASEVEAARFFAWMAGAAIAPQFILYDAQDVQRLRDLQARGVVPMAKPFMLFVLGRYAKEQRSTPGDLGPFLTAAKGVDWPWMLCAFGARERDCMSAAGQAGGHARVGFENNLHLPDGTLAPDNAALVRVTADAMLGAGRDLADADAFRRMMAEWA